MIQNYILAALLDVTIGLYFFGLYGLVSVASVAQGKKRLWKLPLILLAFGSFAININVAWEIVAWLGFEKGTDGQATAYFIWMAPMCLGILSAMYYFKIRKDILKKKQASQSDSGSGTPS